jgi:flagellar biosynthesis protein FlhA
LVSFAPTVERVLNDTLQVNDHGSYLALEPNFAQRIITRLKFAAEKFTSTGATPVLLVPPAMRSAMHAFLERFVPGFVVLSHQEITPSTRVQSLGLIALEDAS